MSGQFGAELVDIRLHLHYLGSVIDVAETRVALLIVLKSGLRVDTMVCQRVGAWDEWQVEE